MKKADREPELQVRPRPKVVTALEMPGDVLRSLELVAHSRDMSVEALMRFYVGQGLRQDLARLFSERMLDTTANVLAKHLHSADEVSLIIEEIREAAGAR